VTWGDLRPQRTCEWKEDDDRVTLLVPRFGRGRLGRLMGRLFNPRPLDLHLDDIGSFAWRRLDGVNSVSDITTAMRRQFGEKTEPAEDRVVTFLTQLLRDRLVTLDPHV
jgi:hypothetical protein